MRKKGVTLVELLAVIVILGLIAFIAVPLIGGLINRVKENADQIIVDSLNQATQYYIMAEVPSQEDAFEGLDTNSQRINVLFSYGYLTALPQPNSSSVSFEWDIENQIWKAENYDFIGPVLGFPDYQFSDTRLLEVIENGSSISVGSFTDTGSSIDSGGGLIYIPNPNENYELIVSAQILSTGTNGGFGVLFDTVVSNLSTQSDTGFAVQLDRGLGSIVIRPRIDGREQNRVAEFPIRFSDNGNGDWVLTGGTSNRSHEWWLEIHTLKVVVEDNDHVSLNKVASIYLDNIYLFDFQFESSINELNKIDYYTGFRAWNGVNVAFYSLTIN